MFYCHSKTKKNTMTSICCILCFKVKTNENPHNEDKEGTDTSTRRIVTMTSELG